MSDYSPEAFEVEQCIKYRAWPECAGMTDQQIYDLTHETVDDMDEEGWRLLFKSKGAINLSVIRESFEDIKGRELKMSDKLLAMTISHAGKAWEAFSESDEPEKAACDFLEKAEKEVDKVAVVDPGITALVSKIDDVFKAELNTCIEAAMKNKTTAVDMYAQFKRTWTKDELDQMPVPGTEANKGERNVPGTNKLADRRKTNDRAGNPITIVWWNNFCSDMQREGVVTDFESEISDIQLEIKTPGSVKRLANISKMDLKSKLSDATARRNALRSMCKRAGELHHQWEAIKAMPHLDISWIGGNKPNGTIIPKEFGQHTFESGKKITGSPKPIWINAKGEPASGRDFSVTQVLNFDVAKALAQPNGGNMAELIASGKGGEETPEETTEVMTPDKRDTDIIELHAHLKMRDNMAAFRKALNEPDQDELKDSTCSLFLLLKPIYLAHQGWYENKNEMPHEDVA